MDLSPYQFKAPFEAYEFGHFVAAEKPDLVIVLMNWLDSHPELETEEVAMEHQYQMQSLSYWFQRIIPCIERNVSIMICNRVGLECGDAFSQFLCGAMD